VEQEAGRPKLNGTVLIDVCTFSLLVSHNIHMYHLLETKEENLYLFHTYVYIMVLKTRSAFHLNSIKGLVFIVETQCVFCEIGTEFLNTALMNFRLQRV
jgi:hypothetical protein